MLEDIQQQGLLTARMFIEDWRNTVAFKRAVLCIRMQTAEMLRCREAPRARYASKRCMRAHETPPRTWLGTHPFAESSKMYEPANGMAK